MMKKIISTILVISFAATSSSVSADTLRPAAFSKAESDRKASLEWDLSPAALIHRQGRAMETVEEMARLGQEVNKRLGIQSAAFARIAKFYETGKGVAGSIDIIRYHFVLATNRPLAEDRVYDGLLSGWGLYRVLYVLAGSGEAINRIEFYSVKVKQGTDEIDYEYYQQNLLPPQCIGTINFADISRNNEGKTYVSVESRIEEFRRRRIQLTSAEGKEGQAVFGEIKDQYVHITIKLNPKHHYYQALKQGRLTFIVGEETIDIYEGDNVETEAMLVDNISYDKDTKEALCATGEKWIQLARTQETQRGTDVWHAVPVNGAELFSEDGLYKKIQQEKPKIKIGRPAKKEATLPESATALPEPKRRRGRPRKIAAEQAPAPTPAAAPKPVVTLRPPAVAQPIPAPGPKSVIPPKPQPPAPQPPAPQTPPQSKPQKPPEQIAKEALIRDYSTRIDRGGTGLNLWLDEAKRLSSTLNAVLIMHILEQLKHKRINIANIGFYNSADTAQLLSVDSKLVTTAATGDNQTQLVIKLNFNVNTKADQDAAKDEIAYLDELNKTCSEFLDYLTQGSITLPTIAFKGRELAPGIYDHSVIYDEKMMLLIEMITVSKALRSKKPDIKLLASLSNILLKKAKCWQSLFKGTVIVKPEEIPLLVPVLAREAALAEWAARRIHQAGAEFQQLGQGFANISAVFDKITANPNRQLAGLGDVHRYYQIVSKETVIGTGTGGQAGYGGALAKPSPAATSIKFEWNLNWVFEFDAVPPKQIKQAIKDALKRDNYKLLLDSLCSSLGREVGVADIEKVKIENVRPAKDQLPMKVTVSFKDNTSAAFCLHIAKEPSISKQTKKEFKVLKYLYSLDPRYIIEPFHLSYGRFRKTNGIRKFQLCVYTSRWMDDYKDIAFNVTQPFVPGGYELVMREETLRSFWQNSEVFFIMRSKRIKEQIIKILTLYYLKSEGQLVKDFLICRGDFGLLKQGNPDELMIFSARGLEKISPTKLLVTLCMHMEYFIEGMTGHQDPCWVDWPFDVLNGMQMALEEYYGQEQGRSILKQWLSQYLQLGYGVNWLQSYGQYAVKEYIDKLDKPMEVKINNTNVYVNSGTTINQVLRDNGMPAENIEVYVSLCGRKINESAEERTEIFVTRDSFIVDRKDWDLPIRPFDNIRIMTIDKDKDQSMAIDKEGNEVLRWKRRPNNLVPDDLDGSFTGTIHNLFVEPFNGVKLTLNETYIFDRQGDFRGYPVTIKFMKGYPAYFMIDRSSDGKEPLRIMALDCYTTAPMRGRSAYLDLESFGRIRVEVLSFRTEWAVGDAINALPEALKEKTRTLVAFMPFFVEASGSVCIEKIAEHLEISADEALYILSELAKTEVFTAAVEQVSASEPAPQANRLDKTSGAETNYKVLLRALEKKFAEPDYAQFRDKLQVFIEAFIAFRNAASTDIDGNVLYELQLATRQDPDFELANPLYEFSVFHKVLTDLPTRRYLDKILDLGLAYLKTRQNPARAIDAFYAFMYETAGDIEIMDSCLDLAIAFTEKGHRNFIPILAQILQCYNISDSEVHRILVTKAVKVATLSLKLNANRYPAVMRFFDLEIPALLSMPLQDSQKMLDNALLEGQNSQLKQSCDFDPISYIANCVMCRRVVSISANVEDRQKEIQQFSQAA